MRSGPGGALANSKENTGFSLTGSKVWMRSSSRSLASRTASLLTKKAGMPLTSPVSIGCMMRSRRRAALSPGWLDEGNPDA